MKVRLLAVLSVLIFTAVIGCSLAGCGEKPAETSAAETPVTTTASAPNSVAPSSAKPTVATGKPTGTLKVGDMAVCAVCAVKEGTTTPEHVKDVLDYKGQTYGFCNESEKAEFIGNPAKYAQVK